jgi:hypothetical protein
MMRTKSYIILIVLAAFAAQGACSKTNRTTNNPGSAQSQTTQKESPAALPDEAFKAYITLDDPPAKLRTSEPVVVQVRFRNDSPVFWWSRGGPINTRPDNKFYIAAGNRWLKSDGSLLTSMDGRYGISKDLKPGEENEVPLKITAPKDAGEYILEVDLVQEGVAWFSDKGSPTARTKVTVVK